MTSYLSREDLGQRFTFSRIGVIVGIGRKYFLLITVHGGSLKKPTTFFSIRSHQNVGSSLVLCVNKQYHCRRCGQRSVVFCKFEDTAAETNRNPLMHNETVFCNCIYEMGHCTGIISPSLVHSSVVRDTCHM